MDGCRVSHEEYFNLTRELQKKTKEVTNLQKLLSDAQLAIFDERKELLKVLAENDALKSTFFFFFFFFFFFYFFFFFFFFFLYIYKYIINFITIEEYNNEL